MKYNNFETIRKNKEFQEVYSLKNSYANRHFVIYIKEYESTSLRLGISVSKKVGNSVIRHKICRLVREAFRLNSDKMRRGFDVVIIARKSVADKGYKEVEESIIYLLKKASVLVD